MGPSLQQGGLSSQRAQCASSAWSWDSRCSATSSKKCSIVLNFQLPLNQQVSLFIRWGSWGGKEREDAKAGSCFLRCPMSAGAQDHQCPLPGRWRGQKQPWRLLCCRAVDFKCHHFYTAGSPSCLCSRNAIRHVTCSLSPLLGLGEGPTSLQVLWKAGLASGVGCVVSTHMSN